MDILEIRYRDAIVRMLANRALHEKEIEEKGKNMMLKGYNLKRLHGIMDEEAQKFASKRR